MDEEIKRLMELWPKYPISKEKQVHFITETWSFKSESIDEAKRAFEYFKLWKENILNKWYFYEFIGDQLVYYPLLSDTFSSLTLPAALCLKISLKSKASKQKACFFSLNTALGKTPVPTLITIMFFMC